jgi:hypothetical protein
MWVESRGMRDNMKGYIFGTKLRNHRRSLTGSIRTHRKIVQLSKTCLMKVGWKLEERREIRKYEN